MRAYKTVRLSMEGPQQVSVSTWRRSIAALDKWVAWAIYEGLLERSPFRYVDRTVLTPQGLRDVRVNSHQEPSEGPRPIEFVPFDGYLLWRDVGLRGQLPNGQPDPAWRGRHGERNAMFADLLVYTGMRLGEAASLRRRLAEGETLADHPADLLRIWSDDIDDLNTLALPGIRLLDIGRKRYREAVAEGCSKAGAVSKLAAGLGISQQDVWAFGDGSGDRDLLEWAGTGVAMRNAVPAAITAADTMTLYPHDNDGVARLLEAVLQPPT